MNNQIDKGSYSGDQVVVALKNDQQVVIKRSEHNAERLLKCAALQKTNLIFGENIFPVPILRMEQYSDHAEIEMPYQHGLSGENLYLYADPLKVLNHFTKLIEAVRLNISTSEQFLGPHHFQAIAANKIKRVTAQEMCKEMVEEDHKAARRLALLKEHDLELPVSIEN